MLLDNQQCGKCVEMVSPLLTTPLYKTHDLLSTLVNVHSYRIMTQKLLMKSKQEIIFCKNINLLLTKLQ